MKIVTKPNDRLGTLYALFCHHIGLSFWGEMILNYGIK